jgi:hypothetical protein
MIPKRAVCRSSRSAHPHRWRTIRLHFGNRVHCYPSDVAGFMGTSLVIRSRTGSPFALTRPSSRRSTASPLRTSAPSWVASESLPGVAEIGVRRRHPAPFPAAHRGPAASRIGPTSRQRSGDLAVRRSGWLDLGLRAIASTAVLAIRDSRYWRRGRVTGIGGKTRLMVETGSVLLAFVLILRNCSHG